MEIIYYPLIAVAFALELSSKCNTNNIGKKFGLAIIIIGSLLHLYHKPNNLVEYGISIYFLIEFIKSSFDKYNRRSNDRVKQ